MPDCLDKTVSFCLQIFSSGNVSYAGQALGAIIAGLLIVVISLLFFICLLLSPKTYALSQRHLVRMLWTVCDNNWSSMKSFINKWFECTKHFSLVLKMPALHRTHISFSFTSFLWDEFAHYNKLNLKIYCSWLIFPLDGNLGKLTRCYKWHHSAHLVVVFLLLILTGFKCSFVIWLMKYYIL